MKRLFFKIICALICGLTAVSLCGCNNINDPIDQDNQDNQNNQNNSNNSSDPSRDQSEDAGNEGYTAEEMVERALSADEWPAMDLVTEQNYVNALFSEDIVLEDCEDYCLASNIISSQLCKILVVKPKEDKVEAIQTAMDEYYEYVRTEGVFYPDQQASAAGSVKGKTENGYIYIVVHPNGTLVTDKMLS